MDQVKTTDHTERPISLNMIVGYMVGQEFLDSNKTNECSNQQKQLKEMM